MLQAIDGISSSMDGNLRTPLTPTLTWPLGTNVSERDGAAAEAANQAVDDFANSYWSNALASLLVQGDERCSAKPR